MVLVRGVKKRNYGFFSVGLVIFLIQIFMLVRAHVIFPPDQVDSWRMSMLIYMVMYIGMYSITSLRNKFLKIDFKSFFYRVFVYSILTFGLLSFGLKSLVGNIFGVLSTLTFGTLVSIIFYHVFVAFVEQTFFFGFIYKRLKTRKMFFSSLIFAVFHFVFNVSFFVFLGYFALALIFIFLQEKLTPNDSSANIGFHAGYDIFKEGLIKTKEVLL